MDAAKVRMFMDRLVGWDCSKVSRMAGISSMGRVQTPTLGFIVDRELEREKHVPKKYHSVNFNSGEINFKIRFHEKNEEGAWIDDSGVKPKHFPERTFDLDLAKRSVELLKKNSEIKLISIKNSKQNRKAKPPFTTDTMLQTANSALGWSLSRTSGVASDLYEKGHITYIRTDSTRTNEDARNEVKKYIVGKFGEGYIGQGVLGPDAKKDSANVQDAHEAIRPTRPGVREISDEGDDLLKLYRLIWSRFTGSQMSESIREIRTIKARTEGLNNDLAGTASWRIHSGWEEVFREYQGEVKTKPPENNLEVGEIWAIDIKSDNPELVSDQTKPPRRYSESSIVQEMKKAGIGRPSTYVSMVQLVQKKSYVENNNGALIPTDTGKKLWLEVVPFYNNQPGKVRLFSTQFTASMESKLDDIANDIEKAPDIWHSFVEDFKEINTKADSDARKTPSGKQIKLLIDLLSNMSEIEQEKILKGKEINSFSRNEIKPIIDNAMNQAGPRKASEKQIGLVIKKCDDLGLILEELLQQNSIEDLDSLTGGRDGSASVIISQLIEMDGKTPATERQIKAIKTMAERLEIKIEDAVAIVRTTTIEEINKIDASNLIGKMKKMKKKSR